MNDMDMNEKTKKFEALMKNEENVKDLLSNKTPEEAQVWLKEHGLEYSMDEVQAIGNFVKAVASGEVSKEDLEAMDKMYDRELADDELKAASGGVWTGISPAAALGGGVAAAGVGLLVVGYCVAAYGAHEWGWFGGWDNFEDYWW